MLRWNWLILTLVVLLLVGGCSKKEEPVAEAPKPAASEPAMPAAHPPVDGTQEIVPPAAPRQIVVPEEVKAAWKSVVLQLADKGTGNTQDVTVSIGQSATVEGLEITVENFLPHFSMGGGTISSASNETMNPAVQLVVTEGGAEVFSGWLFSLYPDAHPFEHEKYGLILKDFKKAE
jgi:hypothetical protein